MVQGRREAHGWERILDRSWLLPSAAAKTTKVEGELQGSCFHVIRDDLLHPIMGGNKLRKLDALIPLLQAHGVTDMVRRLRCNPVLFFPQPSQTYPNFFSLCNFDRSLVEAAKVHIRLL